MMNTRSTLILGSLLLASPAVAQRMITCESNRNVSEIDITTGAKTLLGTLSSNAATAGGLAYDAAAGKLYLTSTSADSVYLVDTTDWTAQLIGPYGDSAIVMHGLEWHSGNNTLYGMSSHNNGLYTVDTTTGTATLVGQTGLTSFHNLGYDPTTDVMYMSNSGTDSFYTIDVTTGAATLIGPLNGPTNPNGLAFSLDDLTLYLVDNSTDNFYSIDTTTGQANLIGSMGSGNTLGLAYLPGSGRLSRAAHGCGPTTMFVSGNPNLGGAVEFTVGNTTGFPFVGFGTTQIGLPFCGCTVGHDWAVALGGANATLAIPAATVFIGAQVFAQGLDFLGTGGCPSPALTLTDTITVTVGF